MTEKSYFEENARYCPKCKHLLFSDLDNTYNCYRCNITVKITPYTYKSSVKKLKLNTKN